MYIPESKELVSSGISNGDCLSWHVHHDLKLSLELA